MSWSYSAYVGANVGISIALILITIVIVLLLPYSSKLFLIERVFGIYLEKSDSESTTIAIYDIVLDKSRLQYSRIEWMFITIVGIILSLMPVLLFNGLFLGIETMSNGDKCPNWPMDCFVFPKTTILSSPIATFMCKPGAMGNFPNSTDGFAWCYGWVIMYQSSVNVLNQLGLCAGLIGLFATIFAFTFHIGHRKVGFAIVLFIIVCLVVALIALAVYKLSLAFLTFATLFLCGLMCTFGLLLKRVVTYQPPSKREDQATLPKPDLQQPQKTWFHRIKKPATTSKYRDTTNMSYF